MMDDSDAKTNPQSRYQFLSESKIRGHKGTTAELAAAAARVWLPRASRMAEGGCEGGLVSAQLSTNWNGGVVSARAWNGGG
jgi:hypothetical protein